MNLRSPMKGSGQLWVWSVVAIVALLLVAAVVSLAPRRANEIITIAGDTATFVGIIALVMGLYQYIKVQQPEARLREALEDFGEEQNDLKRWFAKHDIVAMGDFAIPRLGELMEPQQTRPHALEALIAIIEDEKLSTPEQVRAVAVVREHAQWANVKSVMALLEVELQGDPGLSTSAMDALAEIFRRNPMLCRELATDDLPVRCKQMLAFILARVAIPATMDCLNKLMRDDSQPDEVRATALRLLRAREGHGPIADATTADQFSEDTITSVERTLAEFEQRLPSTR